MLVVQSREENRVQPWLRRPESSCSLVLMSFSCVKRAASLFLRIHYLLKLRFSSWFKGVAKS